MGHDNQVPKSSNEESEANRPSRESSDIVADWLMLYAQTYKEEVTEELVLFYQQALSELPPNVLHLAFLRAGKNSRFRPTPAEILECAKVEFDKQPKLERSSEGNFVSLKPILELVRPIALKICKPLTGREYRELDPIKDSRIVMDVFRKANIIRYLRKGINPQKWVPEEELAEVMKYV